MRRAASVNQASSLCWVNYNSLSYEVAGSPTAILNFSRDSMGKRDYLFIYFRN